MHSSHTVHVTFKAASWFELDRVLSLQHAARVRLELLNLFNRLRLEHIHR